MKSTPEGRQYLREAFGQYHGHSVLALLDDFATLEAELAALRRVGTQMQCALIVARDAMRAWATDCEDPETIENSSTEIDQVCDALKAFADAKKEQR